MTGGLRAVSSVGPYCSFLVRCWRTTNGSNRLQVQHIQSGARATLASVAAALAWIDVQRGEPAGHEPGPAQVRLTTGEVNTKTYAARAEEHNA